MARREDVAGKDWLGAADAVMAAIRWKGYTQHNQLHKENVMPMNYAHIIQYLYHRKPYSQRRQPPIISYI